MATIGIEPMMRIRGTPFLPAPCRLLSIDLWRLSLSPLHRSRLPMQLPPPGPPRWILKHPYLYLRQGVKDQSSPSFLCNPA